MNTQPQQPEPEFEFPFHRVEKTVSHTCDVCGQKTAYRTNRIPGFELHMCNKCLAVVVDAINEDERQDAYDRATMGRGGY